MSQKNIHMRMHTHTAHTIKRGMQQSALTSILSSSDQIDFVSHTRSDTHTSTLVEETSVHTAVEEGTVGLRSSVTTRVVSLRYLGVVLRHSPL